MRRDVSSLMTRNAVDESWGVSFNWYLNRNLRFMLDYEQTDFTGGDIQGDRPKEHAILTRLQISY